ncbi:MAG: carbohydrate ABC transporter permease [Candidatus Thiodiazotropha endolucinida]|uniref:Carbohydrate ABC transporter permease n=1 Tax=Candidatus Thiodiazotropha taylori TaxID=2792791 RepID=A0A9E4NJG1_9GAMM|nr:carbohydrate ABC transporter permease [Candidatus Thiodiazotropha sp. (ex Codakia orbicularis)]MBV2125895.1 carbohydrate ABC transporter permease [Candidatus Thiodiazotropha taylori]MCG8094709.1 carbohydrate ABC transporter permease [Candidatus Thiodiazotropha endolucinida]MCG7978376.1 carbohydrate ABC transporter permease [Candidatus Thiodiazotropha taylori]MCG8046262.1 carbohydrate ABC transporter permease [Candidatus Thiodiazotropha taylori]
MRATRLSVLLSYLLLGGMAALFIVPLLMMFVGSLKPDQSILVEGGSLAAFLPGEVSLQNYADVFRRSDFLRYFFNSLFITGCIVSSGLLVNSMAAYAFARLQWRGRDLLFNLVLALMILPFEAIAIPLFYGASMLGLRDSFSIQIVPFIANAFAIYLFYSFFIGMPKELEEAARLDGASTLRIFFSIIMPNAKPVFASVAILTFLTWWGSYLWPMMVTIGPSVRPLPVAIASFFTLPPLNWGDILAFGVMMVLPVLLLFIIFQRWFVRGVASSAIKG